MFGSPAFFSPMFIEPQIAKELKEIAIGMAAPPPREPIEQLVARKRQQQGIEACKDNAEQRLGTLVGPRSIGHPK